MNRIIDPIWLSQHADLGVCLLCAAVAVALSCYMAIALWDKAQKRHGK